MHYFAAAVMFFISIVILIDVTGRVGFDSPFYGAPEIIANSIVFVAFMQLPYAVRTEAMLRVEAMEQKLPEGARRLLAILHYIAGAALFGMLAFASWAPMLRSVAEGEYYGEGALRVAAWPLRIIIVIASVAAAVEFCLAGIRVLKGGEIHPAPAEPDGESFGSEGGL